MRSDKLFINVCVSGTEHQRKQFLYEISKLPSLEIHTVKNSEDLQFRMMKSMIPYLKQVRRKCGVRIKFYYPSRMNFLRFPIIIALLVFISIPFFSRFYFLSIHVEGPDELAANVEIQLKEQLIDIPRLKSQTLSNEQIRMQLMKSNPSIAWVLIDRNHAQLKVSIIEAPKILKPADWPSASQFVSSHDAQVERVFLLSGERHVHRKSVVRKGELLASSPPGGQVKGQIIGIYWQTLQFELQTEQKSKFSLENSHLLALLEKFIEQLDTSPTILEVKVLQVQNDNGKVKGKVLMRLKGNIAKPNVP